jgi:WD40 repeat protein
MTQIEPDNPIIQHETSVYALQFDSDDDLWTASADGTSKCLSRDRGWEADTTLQHGDYVRAITIDERGGWVVTAGRDEDVKVWDRASGKLHHVYEGHFEEVTGLLVLGRGVVSVGIDATVRQWDLSSEGLGKAVRDAEEGRDGVEKEMEKEVVVKPEVGGLTEEEERELEDLMEDSE